MKLKCWEPGANLKNKKVSKINCQGKGGSVGKGVSSNWWGKAGRKIDSEEGHHQQIKLFGKHRSVVARSDPH